LKFLENLCKLLFSFVFRHHRQQHHNVNSHTQSSLSHIFSRA
jgi:hypothetical protein